MNNRETLIEFLKDHNHKKPVSFHMPGHKGSDIFRENGYGYFLDNFMDMDITEIPGADNLFQPETVIKNIMDRYKNLYESEETYILINGSSAGLIAAIMTAVEPGGKIVMARNCHKSVFNGLELAGAEPVYAYPHIIEEYGVSGEIPVTEIERTLEQCPDASAVILPSPNYYGICSDIRTIAEYVHSKGKILIVDQAHGAHLKFFDKFTEGTAKAAENLGADIVINSTHKTLASYTQSAIVNLCSNRVDKYKFEDKLQAIESTSPSYILMASLDINGEILEYKGEALINQWNENIEYFYREAAKIKGLRLMKHPLLDPTKINLDMSDYGIDGLTLEQLLMEKNVYVELVTGNIIMCMSGIGNKLSDYQILLDALIDIASTYELKKSPSSATQYITMKKLHQTDIPKAKEKVKLELAAGRVCGFSIIPYPPGIPLMCPGEILDHEVIEYVRDLREKGEKVMGIDDLGRVIVNKL